MKVYIKDYGLSCALGNSKEEVAKNLFDFNFKGKSEEFKLVDGQTSPRFIVSGDLPKIPNHLKQYDSRNNRLILMSLLEIKKSIDLVLAKVGKSRLGVIIGTSTSGIAEGIDALKASSGNKLPANFNYQLQEIGSPSAFIEAYLGLESITYTISTACSSSARSFIEAKSMMDAGICDAVIVGGSDSLNELTLNGFHCLEALSLQQTNPMSKNRNGINIGEGAAIFLLTKDKSELEYLGGGSSSDAHHISSPDPSGAGAKAAMEMALRQASIKSSGVDYINLHGTGTPKNDEMEAIAVAETFIHAPFVSSTKPLIGHCLGAAGGLEIAFCALTLSTELNPDGVIPAHHWDGEVDPNLSTLNLTGVVKGSYPKVCMSNSYAFGGNNASIIIGKS
jgi:3-oxoacyl-[acyl-carrier-protein] synthase-1